VAKGQHLDPETDVLLRQTNIDIVRNGVEAVKNMIPGGREKGSRIGVKCLS
jgi:hypothetical protein